MAASAYAALGSLTHFLEQIRHPARHGLHFDRRQLETLDEMVSLILHFLEDNDRFLAGTDEADFMRMVANFASEAEDVLHSKIVDQLSHRSAETADICLASFTEDMDRIIQKFKLLEESSVMIKEKLTSTERTQPSLSLPAATGSSAPPAPYGKNTLVGFDDHLARIKDQLTEVESGLQIVPIVGMGGIGKTTLAQNIFHDPCFKKHFDILIWFTVSQEYSVQDILVGLLGQVGDIESSSQKIVELGEKEMEKLGEKEREKEEEKIRKKIGEFGQKLRKKLFGRRYLIILDDVWSANVWDDLKLYFPDTSEGSRIIVTTRLSSISDSLGNENSCIVDLLDDEKSWELLSEKVFGKVSCSNPKLEEIGRRIATNCKGLPLAIVVIGGLLSRSNMTFEKWEEVAKNVNSIVNSEADELYLNILSLSYNQLPIHLKPCFLYMRVFPEDYMIDLNQLIDYWVTEGFVISKGGKTLAEVAKGYLEDLIARNLLLIGQSKYRGKTIVGIHDLLRDFCLREHQKEQLLHIRKVYIWDKWLGNCHLCGDRYASRETYFRKGALSSNAASSKLFSKETLFGPCRVCDICKVIFPRIRTLRCTTFFGCLIPTRMRYLFLKSPDVEFTSIPLFWNLETLIARADPSSPPLPFPPEIWEMPQLRHVKIYYARFHDPPATATILQKLETLGFLVNFRCSEEILERIPNLKKLQISYHKEGAQDFSFYLLHNLERLRKLESLTFCCHQYNIETTVFPSSLKKLKLISCDFPWEGMKSIGSFPNLEVLILGQNAFDGEEWNPAEGGFLQLKRLSIYENYLVEWNAEKDHFPKLESLLLNGMTSLKQIPSGFGEIETLRSIRLEFCSIDVVNSAEDIVAEQESYGNVGIQLHIRRWFDRDED